MKAEISPKEADAPGRDSGREGKAGTLWLGTWPQGTMLGCPHDKTPAPSILPPKEHSSVPGGDEVTLSEDAIGLSLLDLPIQGMSSLPSITHS